MPVFSCLGKATKQFSQTVQNHCGKMSKWKDLSLMDKLENSSWIGEAWTFYTFFAHLPSFLTTLVKRGISVNRKFSPSPELSRLSGVHCTCQQSRHTFCTLWFLHNWRHEKRDECSRHEFFFSSFALKGEGRTRISQIFATTYVFFFFKRHRQAKKGVFLRSFFYPLSLRKKFFKINIIM